MVSLVWNHKLIRRDELVYCWDELMYRQDELLFSTSELLIVQTNCYIVRTIYFFPSHGTYGPPYKTINFAARLVIVPIEIPLWFS